MPTFSESIQRQNPQDQLDLFTALEKVADAADQEWMKAAEARVRYLCQTRVEWTGDDVWDGLQNVHTKEPRALGAVIRQAAKDGWCIPTERYQKSRRPESHRRPLQVWESRLIHLPS